MKDRDPMLPRPEGGMPGRRTHQPADPRDLEAFPPADARCAGIRELLRDHADGDLSARERLSVDEHVHTCRDCGLALSRAELEVVRIRKALDEERRKLADVPANLTKSVLAAVGREVVARDGAPPADFTETVMERVRREWRRPTLADRLGAAPILAAAAVVIVGLATALGVALWRQASVPGPHLEIARATGDASILENGFHRPARPGERIERGSRLRTAPDGGVDLVLRRSDDDSRFVAMPGASVSLARLELAGGSELDFDSPSEWALRDGNVEVRTERALVMRLEGLGEVHVDAGSYDIALRRARRFDANVWPEADVRARVAVFDGAARIVRGVADPELVVAGQVAHVDGASPVTREPVLDDRLLDRSRLAASGRRVSEPFGEVRDPTISTWSCRVIDGASGRGVENAAVRVVMGDRLVTETTTDDEGWFRFTSDVSSGSYAVLRVMPPEGASLASFGPLPRRLDLLARSELAPIVLSGDMPVTGTVWAPDQSLVAAARVVPCIVDEVFGVLERLESLETETGEDGRFTLRRLPHGLPRGQTLALLVEAQGHARTASVALGRRLEPAGEVPLDVHMGESDSIRVAGLAPNEEFDVLREIPGVPLMAFVEVFSGAANAEGEATVLHVGPGPRWIQAGGVVRRLVPQAESPDVLRPAEGSPVVSQDWLMRMDPAPVSWRHNSGGQPWHRVGHRFARVWTSDGEGVKRFLALRDPARAVVPGARVFAVRADGSLGFVGATDGTEVVPLDGDLPDPVRIVAIAADGSVGVLDSEALEAGADDVPVTRPADVVLGDRLREELAEGALIGFEPLTGALAGEILWRSVTDGRALDLPAGQYRVVLPDGSLLEIELVPGARAELERD